MELFLLVSVALVVFGAVVAAILLWVSFRRTIELRGALLDASDRIERLERALASARAGAVQAAESRPIEPPAQDQLLAPPREALDAPPTEAPKPVPPPPAPPRRAAPPSEPNGFVASPLLAGLACALIAASAFAAASVNQLHGPAAAVVALIASAAAIAIGEWLRRARPAAPLGYVGALTAFGLALMMASAGLAALRFGAISSAIAFFFCAAAAIGAMALSELYGAAILAFGLAAALALPALIDLGPDGALPRHAFLVALTAVAVVLARRREARMWAWIAGAGALLWGFVSVVEARSAVQVGGASAFLAALASIGMAYAWEDARTPLGVFGATSAPAREPLIAGSALSLLSAALLVALFARSGAAAPWAGSFLLTLAAGAALAAAFADALAGVALLIAAAAISALAVWPTTPGAPADAATLLISAGALALLCTFSGWMMMAQARLSAPGALLAALGPTAALICVDARLGLSGGREIWAGAALVAAALNALFWIRSAGQTRDTGAAAAFAAGALFAAAAALGMIAPEPWRAPATALALPAIALLDKRLRQRSLRLAAAAIAALVVWRLTAPILSGVQSLAASVAAPPGLNALAVGCAGAAAPFLLASYLFRGERLQRNPRMTKALFAGAVLLLSAGLSIATRHAFTNGALADPYASLGEMGLHAIVWTGAAALLAWRFGPRPGQPLFWIQAALLVAATAHVLFFGIYWLNPWWGAAPGSVLNHPILNALLLAYAAPALVFGAYAWLCERQWMPVRANLAMAVALVLFLLWATLEIRRFFHPADLARPPVSPSEGWALTLTWVVLAGSFAVIAEAAGRRVVAAVARALAAAALVKSAILDLGGLDGLVRLAALLAIGLACFAILLLRNRSWTSLLGGVPDPNLTPPR